MPFVTTNGIRLSYQRAGHGDPVLLIMGSGAGSRVWTVHQTPALHRAGYETIVFDNRGIAPSDSPAGKYTLAELTADTRGLIEALDLGPCHLVGTSLGAMIAQELALQAPHLVRSAVLLATRARSDVARRAMAAAERLLLERGVELPARYQAVRTVLEMLSPATLNDDTAVAGWLDLLELAGATSSGGQAWIDVATDRREALRRITVPCRAIACRDDLICPPHLVAEVADAIPDCDLVEIPDCGHLGHLERPDEINTAIIEFLDKH
ncbi:MULTISPECIES: alpha/beta fold hydrolase [unclassified Kitasatospora]|uniref:alpha/beta fold hydrolase n=1 Tax=unclassified Kitasatospora TaxID=2633591 RepID=UPI001AE0C0D4|nr:alpha/beta hydrolase [Kitasatospora sp. RG8]MBP0453265.1 alpha/beta hydrolase [Kitasatospora sp. RG8]